MKRLLTLITTLGYLGLICPGILAADSSNPILDIGIVQRFGRNKSDQLILKAKTGDHLTLKFPTPEGEKTLQTQSVILKIHQQPLAKPRLEERVILSQHRSYESAETSANTWRTRGIEVEIAQPDQWQVWAKRDVYKTPLLRHWLHQSIQVQQHPEVVIQSQIQKDQVQAYWDLGGYRYNRHELEISAQQNLIEVSTRPNDREPRLYPGTLRLQPNAYHTYTLVNQVPLETYLRGVVPHEIGAWPPRASLEAQAILSRTYVLQNLHRFTVDNYQLCANTHCQVYKGLTEVYPSTDQAIANTRAQVLTYNNQLVDALYSALSGGITADFRDIWQGEERPYLQPVVDAVGQVWNLSANSLADEGNFRRFMQLKQGFTEEGWPLFRWREDVNLNTLQTDLKKYLTGRRHPLANFQKLEQLQITQRSATGRVLQLEVKTDLGVIKIAKDEVQDAFYAPWSTLFYLERLENPDKTLKGYAFIGGGFGHGVGMSQTGSYKLAALGWSSERILQFYFPGTELKTFGNPE